MKNEHRRAIHLIKRCIESLQVNLKGYVVLTEVGSDKYLYSPIIPLLAGADKVFAFVRDTNYGSAAEISRECFNIASELGVNNRLEIGENNLDTKWLSKADIVTNSGMLRPLDSEKLKFLKLNAVIPLMYEAWEARLEDVDYMYCKEHGIKVAGTWENHPSIRVFDYVEILAVKMALEAGYEVKNNNILIWSDDEFGLKAREGFLASGASSCVVTTDYQVLLQQLESLDFVYICDYDAPSPYEHLWDLNVLKTGNPNLGIVHLYGKLDLQAFISSGFSVYPRINGKAKTMTFTLGHVGLQPIIYLQTAGYKVAEELITDNPSNITQIF